MARFVLGGRSAAAWFTTIPGTPTAPTQTEINNAVDLVGTQQDEELVSITGFALQPSSLPMPGFAGISVGNVAGEQTYPDSALTFYKDDTVEVIYSALTQGAVGWVGLMFDGQGSGLEIDLYPATVASRVRDPSLNTPHTFVVNFAISAPFEGTQAA